MTKHKAWWMVWIALTGCSDDAGTAIDTGRDPLIDAALDDVRQQPDGGQADAAAEPVPTQFTIRVEGGGCYGECPDYAVTVNESGALTFSGAQCTAKPGTFSKQIGAAQPSKIAQAIATSRYGSLRDSYVDEADGCAVWTDSPSVSVTIEVDGRRKQIERYLGCEDVPDAKRVDALVAAVKAETEIADWLRGPPGCNIGNRQNPNFADSYRIGRAGAAFGILTLRPGPIAGLGGSWELRDCGEQPLAVGRIVTEPHRRLLLAETDVPLTIAGIGEVGSLVLAQRDSDPVSASALTVDSEIPLELSANATCD